MFRNFCSGFQNITNFKQNVSYHENNADIITGATGEENFKRFDLSLTNFFIVFSLKWNVNCHLLSAPKTSPHAFGISAKSPGTTEFPKKWRETIRTEKSLLTTLVVLVTSPMITAISTDP